MAKIYDDAVTAVTALVDKIKYMEGLQTQMLEGVAALAARDESLTKRIEVLESGTVPDPKPDPDPIPDPDDGTMPDFMTKSGNKLSINFRKFKPDHWLQNSFVAKENDERDDWTAFFHNWGVTGLWDNGDKGIHDYHGKLTHEQTPAGLEIHARPLGPTGLEWHEVAPDWLQPGSLDEQLQHSLAGMISYIGYPMRTGIFTSRQKFIRHNIGNHAALWLLPMSAIWPPELDLYERVRGNGAGRDLSVNYHWRGPNGRESDFQYPFGRLEDGEWFDASAVLEEDTIELIINSESGGVWRKTWERKDRGDRQVMWYPRFSWECGGFWPGATDPAESKPSTVVISDWIIDRWS